MSALLKPKEVAARLSIGYRAVLDLIHAGALPVVQLPGRKTFLVRVETVEALILGSESGATEKPQSIQHEQKSALKSKSRKPRKAGEPLWYEKYAAK